MSDPQTAAVLQEIVRRQRRSLLQYVGEAFPWTDSGGRDGLRAFRRIVDEDRRAAGSLTQHLERHKVPMPFLGAFPNWFTTINFVSLDYLLPKLVDAQRREIANLEDDVPALTEEETRTLARGLLETKRRHLQELESLAASKTQPAAMAN